MQDTSQDSYYILAKSSLADERKCVLKNGEMFAVFRHNGDIGGLGIEEFGVYAQGTRFLSKFSFSIEGLYPLLLSCLVKEDNQFLTADMTNPDISLNGEVLIEKGVIHFLRTIFLQDGVLYESCRVTNYGLKAMDIHFGYNFEADFRDIFEVRGMERKSRGRLEISSKPKLNQVQFNYHGLDGVLRQTLLEFKNNCQLDDHKAIFHLKLKAHESKTINLQIRCKTGRVGAAAVVHDHRTPEECLIETTNVRFNNWMRRSMGDVKMMLTPTAYGLYPYAGIPWYCTVFGRDGLITALQMLWLYPSIAKGVLAYLAHYQAAKVIPQKDAEPGKILHEARLGEMANLNEIPFGLYYGSVDSTPLFIILAGRYYERQQDLGFIKKLWPSLMSACHWIDHYGDCDKDGFVEYSCRSKDGLAQQGWKDSHDSVFQADGRMARGPIALCEVQAYVYEAKKRMAVMAEALGHTALSRRFSQQAQRVQDRFLEFFWLKDLKTYALALDGDKRPCKVRTSNAGHALFSGIAPPEQASVLATELLEAKFFSGWGIRTVAQKEARYNPMSYHNGSIWPHDNALIAYGLDRYGHKDKVLKILNAFFEAAAFMEDDRLPELFCGFERRCQEGPTLYPTACSPQTWASASIFLLIQSCLGLNIDAKNRVIYFDKPVLPAFIGELRIRNLKVGESQVDIGISYHQDGVGIRVIRRQGRIEVLTRK